MTRAVWRHIGLGGMALLALFLALACGGGEEEQPRAGTTASPGAAGTAEVAPASIKWGVWGGAGEMKLYEEARDAFRAKYPQIKIDIISTAGFIDFIQKLNTLAAGNQSPDVIMLGGEWVPVYAEQGVLQPLDPFIEKTPDFRKEDYLPAVMEGLSYEGQLWGLPKDVNVNVLYYNKSAFDEAGLDYPNADWTWDDLLAAAQALTKRSGGRTERYGFAAPAPWTFIWQNGGEVFDSDIEPTRVRIDEPEAVEALAFYYGLSSEYHVSPTPAEVQQTPLTDLFAAGRLAMFQEGRGPTIPFKSIRDFEWGIAPLPHQKVRASILNWAGWCLSSQSKAPEAAWTFIRWLASEEGERIFVGGGNALPGVLSLVGDPDLGIEEAFTESMDYARPSFASSKFAQIYPVLISEVQGIATGENSVTEVTQRLTSKLNQILQSD
jgi:multiple sugar transport system substrate-binding protein